MATVLYLRDSKNSGIDVYRDLLAAVGSAAVTGIVNTVASGTEIQWTKVAAGELLTFISGRAPVDGFTLAGQMTFSIWGKESNAKANCGGRVRVFKRTAAGVETEIGGGPWSKGVEYTTSDREDVWTGTPTSTAFAEDDRLILRVYITNVGTMGGGYLCTLTYNAAASATGDSFLQLTENVTFKAETPPPITGTGNLNHSFSEAGSGRLGFIAAAAIVFGFAVAGVGVQKFVGSGGVPFSHSQAVAGSQGFVGSGGPTFAFSLTATGNQLFSGSGDLPWSFSLTAFGEVAEIAEAIVGSGDLSFVHSQAGVAVQRFTGTGAPVYNHFQSGVGVEKFVGAGVLPFSLSLAGVGAERFEGAGGASFVQSLAAVGKQVFSGSGSLSHTFILAGDGTIGISGFTGSGNLVFPWSLAGQGTVEEEQTYKGNPTFGGGAKVVIRQRMHALGWLAITRRNKKEN